MFVEDDKLDTKNITLTITNKCNLSCVYCYENHKNNGRIDLELAKKIIAEEIEKDDYLENIEVDLFGGEPFLAFDIIKELTEYVKTYPTDKNCLLFATTNGVLVHDEIQSWLRKNENIFVCGLSLDGTREMHNLNRSKSYDLIDLEFFREMYPFQDVKMTVSQQTLSCLADGVIDLHKHGFIVSCNLAYGIDWSLKENEIILEEQLMKLIEFYLENPDVEPCSMLKIGLTNIGNNAPATRYCGAGKYTRAYDINGECYPCQFFMPLSVGEDKAKIAKNIEFPGDSLDVNNLDDKCRECIYNSACPDCFGANYAATGSIYNRDIAMCNLTKIMIKANAFFNAQLWNNKRLKCGTEEEQAILRAIIKIQEVD